MLSFIILKLESLSTIGNKDSDSDNTKLRHSLLIYMGLAMSVGGLLWGSISYYFGLKEQSLIPFGYTLITIFNFLFFYLKKEFRLVQFIQILISILLPFLLQLALGGFIASGAVIIWAILSILISFSFQYKNIAIRWFIFYLFLVLSSGLADKYVQILNIKVPIEMSILFFTMNIMIVSIMIFAIFTYYVRSEEKLKKVLNKKANFDPLTEIFNRRHFFQQAQKEISRAKRYEESLSLMMIDLDFFKQINDNHGHLKGDEILKSFAKTLKSHIRDIDLLARYGGEEFIILIPKTDEEGAIDFAKRVIECAHHIIIEKETDKYLSVSIGLTHAKHSDRDIETMIARADQALYRAKSSGRDQYQVDK